MKQSTKVSPCLPTCSPILNTGATSTPSRLEFVLTRRRMVKGIARRHLKRHTVHVSRQHHGGTRELLGDVDKDAAPLNASPDTSHVVPGGTLRQPKRVKAKRFTSFYPRWIPDLPNVSFLDVRAPSPSPSIIKTATNPLWALDRTGRHKRHCFEESPPSYYRRILNVARDWVTRHRQSDIKPAASLL